MLSATGSAVSPFVSVSSTSDGSTTILSMNSAAAALRSPAAISVYVIIILVITLLIAVYIRQWRRKRRGFGIPTHNRDRSTSFLIDQTSFKRVDIGGVFELVEKPRPAYGDKDKAQLPFDDVLASTKDRHSVAAALAYVPSLAKTIARPPSRNYVVLPGRASSPSSSMGTASVPGSPPGLERSPSVSQAFAAGRERALNNISRHSRGGSSGPSSPASSTSSSSSDMYTAAATTPLPAYTHMSSHQPSAPSPLRVQLDSTRISTIVEEPCTPHLGAVPLAATTPRGSETSTSSRSVRNSKIKKAQRGRPTYATHVRNPRSAETMRQFIFPNRQSLNETEMQITVSEAFCDEVPHPVSSRSQTPNGSLCKGSGGSISSMSGVRSKLHALVGGIKRERD